MKKRFVQKSIKPNLNTIITTNPPTSKETKLKNLIIERSPEEIRRCMNVSKAKAEILFEKEYKKESFSRSSTNKGEIQKQSPGIGTELKTNQDQWNLMKLEKQNYLEDRSNDFSKNNPNQNIARTEQAYPAFPPFQTSNLLQAKNSTPIDTLTMTNNQIKMNYPSSQSFNFGHQPQLLNINEGNNLGNKPELQSLGFKIRNPLYNLFQQNNPANSNPGNPNSNLNHTYDSKPPFELNNLKNFAGTYQTAFPNDRNPENQNKINIYNNSISSLNNPLSYSLNPASQQNIPQIRNSINDSNLNNQNFNSINLNNANQMPSFPAPFFINKEIHNNKDVGNINSLSGMPKKEPLFEIPDFSKNNLNINQNKNQTNNLINPFTNQVENQNKLEEDSKKNVELNIKESKNEIRNNIIESNNSFQNKYISPINNIKNEEQKNEIQGMNAKNLMNQKDFSNPELNVPISKISLATKSNVSNSINFRFDGSLNLSFVNNNDVSINNKPIQSNSEVNKNSVVIFENECKNFGTQKCSTCHLKSKYKIIFYPCNCEVFFCSNPDCFKLIGEIEKSNNSLKKDNLLCLKCNKPFQKFAKVSFFDADKYFEKKETRCYYCKNINTEDKIMLECADVQFHSKCFKEFIKLSLKSNQFGGRIKCPKCGFPISYLFLKSINTFENDAKKMLHSIFINAIK